MLPSYLPTVTDRNKNLNRGSLYDLYKYNRGKFKEVKISSIYESNKYLW